jgi:sphinganine-1-phosphate aldolase
VFGFLKRLTVSMVDTFIADLKNAVKEVKISPSKNGTMVALYGKPFLIHHPCSVLRAMIAETGTDTSFFLDLESFLGLGKSSAVGPSMVGQLAEAFIDTMYKA